MALIEIPFQLPPLADLALLLLLVIVGIIVIVLIAKILLFILPGAVAAVVVWFLTGSLFWTGVAFLVVAFISLLRR